MPRPVSPQPLLFVWHEAHEADALRARRADIQRRMQALPRHSHRFVELRAELYRLTHELIALDLKIDRGAP